MARAGTCLTLMIAATCTQACSHNLAAPQAVAFDEMSSLNREGFDNAIAADRNARRDFAASAIRTEGGAVGLDGCEDVNSTSCSVTYSLEGQKRSMASQAPDAKRMLASISRYAKQMSSLSKAEDLADVKAKAQSAAGSVTALATVVAAPIGAPLGLILDTAVFVGHASWREKRRKALLENAKAAHPILVQATPRLNAIVKAMRSNIRGAALNRVTDAEDAIIASQAAEAKLLRGPAARRGSAPMSAWRTEQIRLLRGKRVSLFGELNDAVDQFNNAGQLTQDFGKLLSAHAKLIATLANPKLSVQEVMSDIAVVQSLLERAETILSEEKKDA